MDRALIIIFALLANILLGGPRALYAVSGLSRLPRIPAKLLRDLAQHQQRTPLTPEAEARRILFTSAGLIIAAIVIGLICSALFAASDFGRFLQMLLLACFLPVRSTWDRVWDLRAALQKKNIHAARSALEGTVWKHHAILDEHGLARAGLEMLAVHFAEKILAVILVFFLAGWPGIFVFALAGLLIEQKLPFATEKALGPIFHIIFYGAPLAVASWLATVLWVFAGLFLSSFNMQRAAASLNEDFMALGARARSIKTVATVLGLSLGGPASAYYNSGWLGAGTSKAGTPDLARGLFLFGLLHLFLFIFLGFFLG